MQIGLLTDSLSELTRAEALDTAVDLGVETVEIGLGGVHGGWSPAPHADLAELLDDGAARAGLARDVASRGLRLEAFNAAGNPLHPRHGERDAAVLRGALRLAQEFEIGTVVTMSGLPGGNPGALHQNWVVNAWNSAALDVLDHQWEIATEFWRETDRIARDHDVTVALELHPQNIVFNSASVHELVERTGSTHLGVELDASHLFWQQMDPVAVVRHLGDLVVHAAAKDVRINPEHAALNGVLDNSFRRLGADEPRTNLGGDEWANEWPTESAWDFVALGKGHDVAYWTEFLRALHEVDPDMLVNIEHEDTELGREEGVAVAAEVLLAADAALTASLRTEPARG